MENKKLRLLVTGTGGFIGSRFLELNRDAFDLLPVSLRETAVEAIPLEGVDAIVHLAGKAHEMKPIPDQIYYDVNYTLTKKLAEEARKKGVPHFIYASSVKVYGDEGDVMLDERSHCAPTDAYGKSKLQAEEMLQHMSALNFRVAIVRPPLVYGPQVKGNMIRLLQLADKNYPLPFGNISNKRSMVYLDNVIYLINTIAEQQATGIFIAGDDAPVSTGYLVGTIRKYLGKPPNLLTIPGFARKLLQAVRPALYTRLFGSYIIDNSLTNRRLHFQPPVTTERGIEEMVEWYRQSKTE